MQEGVRLMEEIDRLVLTVMPHFVAVHYKKMLDAEAWPERVREALCAFELGLRALALGLVSQYLTRDAEKVSDSELNDLLLRRLPTATLGVWKDILFTALCAYEGQRRLFFMPELYDFFWDSSVTPPCPRPDIEAPFDRLVQIYNDLADKQSPADERGWEQLGQETLGLLRTVLAQFTFFERYELIRIVGHDEAGYHYVRYTGLQPMRGETPLQVPEVLNEGWFYLSKDKRAFLELHPLLIFWQAPSQELILAGDGKEGVAVYERYMRDTVDYLVAALWRKISSSDPEIMGDFLRRVWAVLETVKVERLETTRLSWWQLQKVARAISEGRMAGAQGKYRADLYLQRDTTKAAFDRFLASDKTCFVLTGKSGIGKSNFLLALAEEYHPRHPKVCLLMYNAVTFDPSQGLTAVVNADFDNHLRLTGRSEEGGIEDIWRELNRIEGMGRRTVVLALDAINENAQARALLKQVNRFVEGSPWPWLKVVITSRPEAWRNIKWGLTLAEGRYYREAGDAELSIEMQPFTYSRELRPFEPDELPRVYEKYQQVYGLQTPYEKLTVEIKEALRDPLMLWLVAESHRGEEIPPVIRGRDIYEDYVNALIETGRMCLNDVQFLEQELMPCMIREGDPSNAIPARVISGAQTSDGRSLFRLIHAEEVLSSGRSVNVSYRNLVDAQILEQRGDPLDYEIGFKYERFYEYYAGKYIHESNRGREDLVGRYRELVQRVPKRPFLWGAVKRALVLELEEGKRELFFRLAETGDLNMAGLVVAALTDYGERNREVLKGMLSELLEREASAEAVTNAKRVAIEVAANLGMAEILETATRDRSAAIRGFAALHVYYLWTRDKQLGYEIIEKISKRVVSPLGLPRPTAIETMMLISALIGANHLHKDREAVEPLLGVWRKTFSSIPLLKITQKVRPLMLGFGDRIISALVRSHAGDEVRQSLGDFFSLPLEDKQRVCSLANYFDPAYGNLSDIGSDLVHFAKMPNAVMFGLVQGVLLSHFYHDPQGTLPLIKHMFWNIDNRWNRGTTTGAISAALYFMEISPEFEGFAEIVEEFTLDQWRRPTEEVLDRPVIPFSPLLLECRRGLQQSRFVYRALELSGEQRWHDDLKILIHELGAIGLRGYPEFALQTLHQWFGIDEPKIREDMALALARIGALYPREVSHYMLLDTTPRELVQRVGKLAGSRVKDEVIAAGTWELTTGLVLDPVLRPYFVRFIQDAAECPNQRAAEKLVIDTLFSLILR
jgi:hypothetical protein